MERFKKAFGESVNLTASGHTNTYHAMEVLITVEDVAEAPNSQEEQGLACLKSIEQWLAFRPIREF